MTGGHVQKRRRLDVRSMALWLALLGCSACWAADSVPPCSEKNESGKPVGRFVISSSATLRAAPDVSARSRISLPIATPIRVRCEQAGWLHAWAPTFGGGVGWVRADLTGEVAPTLDDLLARLSATSPQDRPQVRQLADRVMALGPLDEGAHEAVIRALEAAGDDAGAARARQRLAALRSPEVRRAPDEPRLILVADGDLASPLAVLDHGTLTSYPQPDERDEEKTRTIIQSFSERYFVPGRAYHFYSRGGVAGLALVKAKEEPSCSSVVARFARVPKGAQALQSGVLTNFELTRKEAQPAVALTEDQRRQMVGLVRALLQAHGVSEQRMQPLLDTRAADDRGLVIDVGPSRDRPFPVLIGTAAVEIYPEKPESETPYRGLSLRVIAEADSAGHYRLTHQEFNEAESEQEFSRRTFLTYLDIDLDGDDELIFSGSGYEWWWYEALGRSGGGWKVLVEGGGGGC